MPHSIAGDLLSDGISPGWCFAVPLRLWQNGIFATPFLALRVPPVSRDMAWRFLQRPEEMFHSIQNVLPSIISLTFSECWTRKLKYL